MINLTEGTCATACTHERRPAAGTSPCCVRACRYETLARVSGVAKAPSRKALKQLMDGDFDPEQWDRYMQETFDDDYYAAPESEVAVREDEVGLAKEMSSWGDDGPGAATDTFAALHARVTGSAAVDLPETDYALGGSAAADRPAEGPESSGDEEEDEDAGGEESASSDGEGGGVSDGEGGDLSAEEQAVHKEKVRSSARGYSDCICSVCLLMKACARLPRSSFALGLERQRRQTPIQQLLR